jgi:uncharacterized membrane protein (DUF106 family)
MDPYLPYIVPMVTSLITAVITWRIATRNFKLDEFQSLIKSYKELKEMADAEKALAKKEKEEADKERDATVKELKAAQEMAEIMMDDFKNCSQKLEDAMIRVEGFEILWRQRLQEK